MREDKGMQESSQSQTQDFCHKGQNIIISSLVFKVEMMRALFLLLLGTTEKIPLCPSVGS
jgi:hypothetical protein